MRALKLANAMLFLSTLSLRRATAFVGVLPRTHKFLSTLSLRRATAPNRRLYRCNKNFYPRSPCGERHFIGRLLQCCFVFLSTLSLRRATADNVKRNEKVKFLSTLSLRRATCGSRASRHHPRHFYPRSPCGERPNDAINGCNPDIISIHALLAESDYLAAWKQNYVCDFYPRSPCGERPGKTHKLHKQN